MSVHSANTSRFVKHVGIYNDKRCAVVLQLPEEPNLVHVVDTDALPDRYHDNLMDIIMSPEGQNAKWLGDVLHRKMFYDGTNALRTLYERGFVQKVPTDRVILSPHPNTRVTLSEVLAILNQQNPQHQQQTSPTSLS